MSTHKMSKTEKLAKKKRMTKELNVDTKNINAYNKKVFFRISGIKKTLCKNWIQNLMNNKFRHIVLCTITKSIIHK